MSTARPPGEVGGFFSASSASRHQRVFLGDKSASGCWSDGTLTTAGRRTLTESKTQRADWEGSCPRLPPPAQITPQGCWVITAEPVWADGICAGNCSHGPIWVEEGAGRFIAASEKLGRREKMLRILESCLKAGESMPPLQASAARSGEGGLSGARRTQTRGTFCTTGTVERLREPVLVPTAGTTITGSFFHPPLEIAAARGHCTLSRGHRAPMGRSRCGEA